MRLSEIEQVVVGEVPLAVPRPVEDGDGAVGQRRHHPALHMSEKYCNAP